MGLTEGGEILIIFFPVLSCLPLLESLYVHVFVFLILTSLIYLELTRVKTSEKRGLDKK